MKLYISPLQRQIANLSKGVSLDAPTAQKKGGVSKDAAPKDAPVKGAAPENTAHKKRLGSARKRAVEIAARKSASAQKIQRGIAQCDADITRLEAREAEYRSNLERKMESDRTPDAAFKTIRAALAKVLQQKTEAAEARRVYVLAHAKLMQPFRQTVDA
jgi:vacuolar-type H+-ATPase subunit I/STV1